VGRGGGMLGSRNATLRGERFEDESTPQDVGMQQNGQNGVNGVNGDIPIILRSSRKSELN
jgi:hypothetical protein